MKTPDILAVAVLGITVAAMLSVFGYVFMALIIDVFGIWTVLVVTWFILLSWAVYHITKKP